MAHTTLFGPNTFAGGDFDSPEVYANSDQGGHPEFVDPPLTGNEKIWWLENAKRIEGAGPNGEDVVDCSDPLDPVIMSVGIVPGALTRNQFDMRPTVDGPWSIEWDQFFSQDYWDINGGYAQLFWIGSDGSHGSSNTGVLFGEDVVFIEMSQTSGYNFDWWSEHYEPHPTIDGFSSPDSGPFAATFAIADQWRTLKLVITPGTATGAPNGIGGKGTINVASDGSIRLYSKLSSDPRSAFALEFEVTGKPIVINRFDNTADGHHYGKGINFANPTTIGAVTNIHAYWGVLDDVEPEERIGSMVVGVNGDVVVERAVLFSLDGNTNVHNEPGKFKVCGNMEVTGTLTVGGTAASSALDSFET